MRPSDYIDIISLVVTSSIGIWIGVSVQKNITTNRGLVEFYIGEIKIINQEYSNFLSELFNGGCSSSKIQEWFKIMNIKIETIQESIVKELQVYPEILASHITMKQFVTGTEEFNAKYSNTCFNPTPIIKGRILEIHSNLKCAFVKSIIDINKAK
jgi:hypothetical protein